MAHAYHEGNEIYYERTGSGPRLLLCNGSGTTVDGSRLLFTLFDDAFDLVVFDYRGMGRSQAAPAPYGMAACAADALAVMDAVGWERSSVLGVSFGGMVAQEIAVTEPGRVERLALLCTSSGGAGGSSYPLHELAALEPETRSELSHLLLDTRFDDEWLEVHPGDRRLVALMDARAGGAGGDGEAGAELQMEARRGHDVWERLGAIDCPTLVACGRFDGIAPPANSAAIAGAVPRAVLAAYEGGHAFFVQDPRAIPDVVDFLTESEPAR